MVIEECSQRQCQGTSTDDKSCKVEDDNQLEVEVVDGDVERNQEERKIAHHIEQITYHVDLV